MVTLGGPYDPRIQYNHGRITIRSLGDCLIEDIWAALHDYFESPPSRRGENKLTSLSPSTIETFGPPVPTALQPPVFTSSLRSAGGGAGGHGESASNRACLRVLWDECDHIALISRQIASICPVFGIPFAPDLLPDQGSSSADRTDPRTTLEIYRPMLEQRHAQLYTVTPEEMGILVCNIAAGKPAAVRRVDTTEPALSNVKSASYSSMESHGTFGHPERAGTDWACT